jgi:hypothetical protein
VWLLPQVTRIMRMRLVSLLLIIAAPFVALFTNGFDMKLCIGCDADGALRPDTEVSRSVGRSVRRLDGRSVGQSVG